MAPLPSVSPVYPTDLLANAFDALPAPALVVDHDIRVIDFNVEAARLMERVPFGVLRPGAGQTLGCVHSTESPEGCGHSPVCSECPIRNAVQESFRTGEACRRLAHLEVAGPGGTSRLELLVSVAPIPDEFEPVALLILDDAAEISRLLDSSRNLTAARRA